MLHAKLPGVKCTANTCTFTVWAPQKEKMLLHLIYPQEQLLEMKPLDYGYFQLEVTNAAPGTRYFYRPDDEKDFPDPASHYQPEGVHGPSEVVDHSAYSWQDQGWRGIPLKDLILYELHVGTFTPEGTFESMIPYLDDLVHLGVNAIELMPVSQFPGGRNWGYDGVYPYAVQNSYGGPDGLKKLVDACHAKGIAVFLDVVYNHLGPEGNYFGQFGPYFTDKYHTPWGDALNFDGEWSDGVRDYFANNVLHWFEKYHFDGLRLDAIHAVYDTGAVHFWEYTYGKVRQLEQKLGRPLYMIAESDLNSPKVVKVPDVGGFGFDGQWLDDFHHALYVMLDKEGKNRYEDFGSMQQLAKAFSEGFVHSGDYVNFRKRKHGVSSAGVSGEKFVVFNQNHDQVGNRVQGERLCMLVDFERTKLAAAAILLSPYLPMLFMGEEYADQSPFFYFVSHSDQDLIKAVQEGRKKEFEGFQWDVEPPDPQDEDTFNRSKLQWHKRQSGKHSIMLEWHRRLIELRKTNPVLHNPSKNDLYVQVLGQQGLVLQRRSEDQLTYLLCIFNFSDEPLAFTPTDQSNQWFKVIDSKEEEWLEKPEVTGEAAPQRVDANQEIQIAPCSVCVYSNK
ncbi:malto-oligosyltrehalose trehalohydrolase [Telluribacter sp. SYSU D00476]|uniref:malto-oligosyltrehalose trehalohydrolase n=1 Tax=Telluribacter sp. SYSU D00476 TaxID=2811430 RepID=UPI0021D4620E|nr:malto-oligosyltrehalose trehalohydrolase [Telluribacter sp. SYSU D00476]